MISYNLRVTKTQCGKINGKAYKYPHTIYTFLATMKTIREIKSR